VKYGTSVLLSRRHESTSAKCILMPLTDHDYIKRQLPNCAFLLLSKLDSLTSERVKDFQEMEKR